MITPNEYFGEVHNQLRDTVRKFVEKEIQPYAQEWEEAGTFPRELYKKAGDLGLLGVGHSEQYGGTKVDLFLKAALIEEMLRCGSSGVHVSLFSHDIGLPPIYNGGTEAIKKKYVPAVISGEKICCLAISEPNGGSDVSGLTTTAIREGDFYRVNGSKLFITSGTRANVITTAVRTGGPGFAGISLLLIDSDTPGFTVGKSLKKTGWLASDTALLYFDNCMVPAENLLGEEGKGFYGIMDNFQEERLNLAIMANAYCQIALEECLEYVKIRSAFGKKIGEMQVIQHKLADMATLTRASQEFTYRTIAQYEARTIGPEQVAMAKNFATDTSDKVLYDAVQIFGGHGYMRETTVERLSRDNRILSIGGGTREIMNEIISKTILR